ncbi:MAG: divergent PAP2 family protein [Candidatus Saccharimonadales bacterium]
MQLIIISFIAWFIAQIIKFSIRAYSGEPSFKVFYQSGGMPSAHTATIVALSFSALAIYGYQSPIFGLSVVFSAVIIYDTLGVRRSSGEQSTMLNSLIRASGKNETVREVIGHSPREVVVGSALGLLVSVLATTSEWSSRAEWLTQPPTTLEQGIYIYIFVGMMLIGLVSKIALSRYRLVEVIYRLRSAIWWAFILPALFGLFFSLLQTQTSGLGSYRFWPLLILLVFVVSQAYLFMRLYRTVPSQYRHQSNELELLRRSQRKAHKATKSKKRKHQRSKRK